MPLGPERLQIADARSLDPLGGENPPVRQGPDDLGHPEALVALGVGTKLRTGGGFHAQIQFAMNHAFEMLHDRAWFQAPGRGRQPFDQRGGKIKGVDISLKGTFNAGAQDLDGNLLAGLGHAGAMNLGDRGSGNRGAEFRIDLMNRTAKGPFDLRPRIPILKRRQTVLKDL